MHIGKWAILLSIFWLLLSGYIQLLLLSFGLVSVFIVLVLLKRMDDVDKEPKQMGVNFKMLQYVPWLILQIVKSSIDVTKLIWGRSDNVTPALAKIESQNVPTESQVLYANSITLTPGTLSVDMDESVITVHALNKASIDDLKKGEMEQKITGIWGKSK